MRTIAATLAFVGYCIGVQAQSNDALLDVLTKEGASVRREAADAKPAATTTSLRPLEAYAETAEGRSALDQMLDDKLNSRMKDKWDEKVKLASYTRVRSTSLMNQSGAILNVPNDGSARDRESLRIRRQFVTLRPGNPEKPAFVTQRISTDTTKHQSHRR